MIYVACFFSGMLLCNCIPHLAAGLMGWPFPSPFAKPPGKGDSYPLTNFLWGFLNLALGIVLFSWSYTTLGFVSGLVISGLGFLLCGIPISLHFGKVHESKSK
jgi:hypothetical protein